MEISRNWLPYNTRIHSGLKTLLRCDEKSPYIVSLRVRNTKGEILKEHWLNHGEPIRGVGALTLDFSLFDALMRESVEGLVEAHILSDGFYRGDVYSYYHNPHGFTQVAYGLAQPFNAPNRPSRYRGFSVHRVDPALKEGGLVLINVSTDPGYSRVAHFEYEVLDRMGNLVGKGSEGISPFGTYWLKLQEPWLRKDDAMLTIFGRCDGSSMISFIYSALEDGRLAMDHTQPPVAQISYGEDLTPGVGPAYRRFRQRVGLKIRYRLNRLDSRPLISFLK